MRVTVIVCTWNRSAVLDGALARLAELDVPPGLEWDVLVVNNACSDATDTVIAQHRRSLPLRRICEPRLGLSWARNRALEADRGDLLLWSDDDVRVDPGWLRSYVDAARAWPRASFFGGPIEPAYDTRRPAWTRDPETVGGPHARLDLGPDERPFAVGETPYGANMAFRRAALGPPFFDPRLGRVGGELRGGEEVHVFESLCAAGHTGVWVPAARVAHRIPPERLRPSFLFAYHRGRGRSLLTCEVPADERTWRGIPLSWLRHYVASRVIAWWRTPRKDRGWARALEEAAFTRGKIDRLLELRREGRDPGAPREIQC